MIFTVSPNLDAVAQRADAIGKSINEVIDEGMKELANRAAETARAFYDRGINDGVLKTELPTVHSQKNGECDYSVIATGSHVCFLEFGAGFGVNADGIALEMPFEAYPGSYSKDHAQMFVKRGFWYSPKPFRRRFEKISATRALFIAAEEFRQNVANGEILKDGVTGA